MERNNSIPSRIRASLTGITVAAALLLGSPPAKGLFQVALVDLRLGSPTFGKRNTMYVGPLRPWQILIPPGVAHGYKVAGEESAMLIYMTDRFYDPSDEGRIAFDDPGIHYDWETQKR